MSEKKGDLLNQLAIISDLLEKINLGTINTTAFFEVDDNEYDKVKKYLSKKYEGSIDDEDSGTFSIVIGDIPFVFSKNSV
jgi:hypothetical protein